MGKEYRWELRRGGGKKLICPKCGQRRFVPYVSVKDHKTLAGAEFGRCDRENNCGYHLYPNQVKDDSIVKVEAKPIEPLRFAPAAVQVDVRTNLFKYVADLLGAHNAVEIWNRYMIGRDGKRTIFWQIAADGSVRAGKSIPYKADGHRDKSDKYPASWLHKVKDWDAYRQGADLQQCYFGEHLLAMHPDAKVIIVESEKTAAVMSQVSRSCVWIASGGSQGLKNAEKNKVLEGRDVWLCPDNGQYWNWKAVADANKWHIYDQIELYPIFEGCDILDMMEAGCFGQELLKYKKQ